MMTMIRRREFTCAILLDTFGRFLLQQRDNVPGIVHPGKIGLFGGHREAGETYLQCIVQEVHEELTCYLPPERFE
jgi:8-oxo-dGTP diphosphatase